MQRILYCYCSEYTKIFQPISSNSAKENLCFKVYHLLEQGQLDRRKFGQPTEFFSALKMNTTTDKID
jgi:hypothetical protein